MSAIKTIMDRQSVRTYKKQAIPKEDIAAMLIAAAHAPSAKNIQNWHYVVVTSQEKLQEIGEIVAKKNEEIAQQLTDEGKQVKWRKFLRFSTFFKDAPVVFFAYANDQATPTGYKELESIQAEGETLDILKRTNPAMQSVGASIQSLSLAATELGYGSCWMTSPNYAAKEITQALGFEKEGYHLVATIPVGQIEGDPKSPPRKSVDEIATFIG